MYADVQKTQEDKVESELGKLMHSEKESLQLILEQVQSAMAKFQGKEDDSNKKKISKLVKEYNAYKKSKLQHFRFNPEKMSTQFGETKNFMPVVKFVYTPCSAGFF